jgi:hypothetical protein
MYVEAGTSRQERLQEGLHAILREISAVQAALNSLEATESEHGVGDGNEADCLPADHQQALSPDHEPEDVRLQRAGLTQRLTDLEAKHVKLQVSEAV